MNKPWLIVLFLLPLLAIAAPKKTSPQAVLSGEERKNSVQSLTLFIENQTKLIPFPTENLIEILPPYLFDFPKAEEPPAEEIKETVEERPVVDPGLSEAELIERVGNALKPAGSIVREGKRILFIRGNRTLADGDTLTMKYRDKTYSVQVINVEANSFELKLNAVVLKFKY